MANPFFRPGQYNRPNNSMMQQFAGIQNMLRGKDPMQLLNQMANGQGCNAEQAKMAKQFQSMLQQNMSPDQIAESALRQRGIDPSMFNK